MEIEIPEHKNPFSKSILKQISEEILSLANADISYDQLGDILDGFMLKGEFKTSTGNKVYKDDLATLVNIAVKKNSNGKQFWLWAYSEIRCR